MAWPAKSSVSWQEQIRTVSSVISALCLLTLTVAVVSAGVYTVNIVSSIQQNPGDLGAMVQNGREAIESANDLLKSEQLDPLLQDFHNLIGVMQQLAHSIDELRVQEVLSEAETWRNMSQHALVHLANSILQ